MRRYQARVAVTAARQKGTLVEEPCEVCGEEKVHAHHDDYSRPLDVRWLCRKHHAEWHRNNSAFHPTSIFLAHTPFPKMMEMTLTAEERRDLKIEAARADIPQRVLIGNILRDWLKGEGQWA